MIGKTVSHYEILEMLGEGGMGVVYRARDLNLDRDVAIKFLPPHLSSDDESKKRFIHEAKSASAVDHKHICTIYEIDESEDNQIFIVMACYDGETLRDRISRGRIPVPEALEIASQISEGLSKAHGREIIHRDIKPQNVIITGEGEVKIIDFGLAKLAGHTRLTKEGSTIGTAAYMSPEQAVGAEIDHRSDIFSLATILYEMLSGVPPFRGEHEAARLYCVVHEKPVPFDEVVASVHPDLQAVIDKGLAKDPEERYGDAREFRDELVRLKEDIVSHAEVAGRTSRRPKVRPRPGKSIMYGLISAISIFALIAAYFQFFRDTRRERDSIAVLPFKTIVSEPGYEWFSDGMTEAIVGHLTKIEGLKVTSSTSTMKFRDTDLAVGDIADRLGVTTILEGSVQQSRERVHIMIKLIDAATDEHIWAEEYDRDIEDVFAVQADVSINVVNRLRASLTSEVKKRIEARPTVDVAAYKLLMEGRKVWGRGTYEDRLEALDIFKKVIEMDPYYADAYMLLSVGHSQITMYGYGSPEEMIPKAKEYALKAIELDGDNAAAFGQLANIASHFEWKWNEAERQHLKVLELNPGNAHSHAGYAWHLMLVGRFDEAVEEHRIALELDPLSVALQQNLGEILFYARRYDEAIEASRRAIEMNPNYPQSHMFIGQAFLGKGMRDSALAELARDYDTSERRKPEIDNWIGSAFASAGEDGKALEVMEYLEETSRENWVSPFALATLNLALGRVDQCFLLLERAYDEHDPRLAFLLIAPVYDTVRDDPRYIGMLDRIGLSR